MAETGTAAARKQSFTSTTGVPIGARLASETLEPRDPYAFQRYCVVRFREELGNPNAKEYGRDGIDILGYRWGDPTQAVGAQCRNIGQEMTAHTTEVVACYSTASVTRGAW